MDLSILGYQFMQNAVMATLLSGVACGTIGVFVVLMHMPFIGVCMAHAAFAGALAGVWLGVNPLVTAFITCLLAAGLIGPLADRGDLSPDTSIGIIFSIMIGAAFLLLGLMPLTKSGAFDFLWGNILTTTRSDVLLLAVVTLLVTGLVALFYKEVQVTAFNRKVALTVGVPATAVFYGILFLTGATITASFSSIGGLMIFSMILNPAAAAYQLTYNLKRMFLFSAAFGVLSGWTGLAISYFLNIPSGATIVLASSVIFMLAAVFSPKRKVKGWQQKPSLKAGLDDRHDTN